MSEAHGWTAPSGTPSGTPASVPSGTPSPPPTTAPTTGPTTGPGGAPGGPAGATTPSGWGPPPGWAGAATAPLKPGIVPLRPLSMGEIYDGAFQAVRTNPGALIGASAVVVAVLYALQTAVEVVALGSPLGAASFDPAAVAPGDLVTEMAGPLAAALTSAALSVLVDLFAVAVLTGVVTSAVSSAVLGRRVGVRLLWQRVRGRLLAVLGTTLLVGLITGAATVLCLAPGVGLLAWGLTTDQTAVTAVGGVLAVLGVLLAIAVVALLSTRLSMAPPAVVLEGQPVVGALRRSWRLTSRSFWRIFGILLLGNVVLGIVAAVIAGPFALLGTVFTTFWGSPDGTGYASAMALLIPSAIGGALAATVTYPLSAAIAALLYIDQRMRLEALDVELARAAAAPV